MPSRDRLPSLTDLVATQPKLSPLRGAEDALRKTAILLAYYRWICLTGLPPAPKDWDADPEWHSSAEVDRAFGSWENMMDAADLDDSPLMESIAQLQRADRENAGVIADRRRELARQQRELESREKNAERKIARAETARDDALRSAQTAREELTQARQELRAAQGREQRLTEAAQKAERQIQELRDQLAAAAEAPAQPAVSADEQLAAQLVALEGQLASAHEALSDAQRREGELTAALQAERFETDRLRAQLHAAPAAAEEPLPTPKTALEAVQIAQRHCRWLRFAPSAEESAKESPFTRPAVILDALIKLDDVAREYEEGNSGRPIRDSAEQQGLRWAPDVSETTKSSKRLDRFYTYAYRGEKLRLGPHVALGSGAGAGNIARIYMTAHAGSEQVPRGLIVGHVGVHLPDSTT